MKEWAKRKKDVWKRCRKELNLFDLGFLTLTNYVYFFRFFPYILKREYP